jgi:uncharacterized protein (DUF2141 family)
MKTIKLVSIIILAVAAINISSCSKDAGFNGNSTIKGNVTNSAGTVVTGAVVSIAFGASAPTSAYNYSTVTDSSGNYAFYDLEKGNYYVGASYTDYVDQGQSFVLKTGGSVVNLGANKSVATANLVVQ